MKEHFNKLLKAEQELLYRAPAIMSVNAVSNSSDITDSEKADAIKLAHLKTFTAVPSLVDYFREVELNFVSNFEEVARKYAPFTDQTRSELKQEILAINAVIEKLDKNFGASLKSSLVKYGEHVNKSDRSVLEDFLLPFKLHGIND